MKKIIAIFLVAVSLFALASCGANVSESGDVNGTEVNNGNNYTLGESITTDLFNITPKFTGYAHSLRNWPDEDFMTPSNNKEDIKDSPYVAGEEKIEIYGEIDIEYIGNEKSNVRLNIDILADYDNGYQYKLDGVGYTSDMEEWDYDQNIIFEPLSSNTKRLMRYCIEVPEVVEKNTDKPLLVTFIINDEKYVFDFRSASVLGSDFDPRDEYYGEIDSDKATEVRKLITKKDIEQWGYYGNVFGVYTLRFTDKAVEATLPANGGYYSFDGTYEIYSRSILITWDNGEQMHMDYEIKEGKFVIIEFGQGR